MGQTYYILGGKMINISSRIIDISENTRPNEKIDKIFKIILHHAPIKNKSGIKNRNYINSLKNQDNIFCSYHYIIGLNGEIINIIPENELAIHTGILEFDKHSLGICICYNENNKISEKTMLSLEKLSIHLIKKYSLDATYDLIRCYDIINRRSPLFFVDNQYCYLDFKEKIIMLS